MKTYVPCFLAIAFMVGTVGCEHYPVPYARAHAPDKIILPPRDLDKKPIVHSNIPPKALKKFRMDG